MRGIASRLLLAGSLSVAAAVGDAIAQSTTIQINGQTAACQATCRIVFDTIVTFGGALDGDKISEGTGLARDSRGMYYTIGTASSSIVVFDAKGTYVKQLGGRGRGPGEFSTPVRYVYVGAGDSLYVFAGSQLHVFSPSHTFVRRVPFGGFSRAVPIAGGRIILRGDARGPATAGFPFHIANAAGVIVRSLGSKVDIRPGPPQPDGQAYFQISDDNAHLWSWIPGEYRFEKWSLEGRKLLEVQMMNVPGWQEPAHGRMPTTPQELQALLSDTSASGAAARARLAAAKGSMVTLLRAERENRLWVWTATAGVGARVDVIDVNSQRLLFSFPANNPPHFLEGTDLAYIKSRATDSIPMAIAVVRARVVSTPAGG